MKRSPVLLSASIVELLRVILIAAAARSLLLQAGNQLAVAILRTFVAGSFAFPALLALAWVDKRFEHFVYLFVPLKIACVIIDIVAIAGLFSGGAMPATAVSLGPVQALAGSLAVVLMDSIILAVAILQLRKPAEPEQPSITIEQVEL